MLLGSQSWYRPLRDLPEERREKFLITVINKLVALETYKDIATSVCTFDPEFEMAKLLRLEYDHVRGLLLPSQAQPQHQGDRDSVIDESDVNNSTLRIRECFAFRAPGTLQCSHLPQCSGMDRSSTNIVPHRNHTSELGPELQFINQAKVRNQRTYSWPLFTIIYEGDVVKATSLIRAREASASDIDPYGLGTAYVCMIFYHSIAERD